MRGVNGRPTVWELARRQHGVVSRRQLLDLGFTGRAIDHRLAVARLHTVWAGAYAVGRPRLTQHGRWMAATLSCGPHAAVSHEDAGALWRITLGARAPIQISVSRGHARSRPGIEVHRRAGLELTRREGIPVTSLVYTLVDLAVCIDRSALETAVNTADKLALTNPEALRSALDRIGRRPGLAVLRRLLDRHTFTLTDSELERRFLPIARGAGLSPPQTGVWLHGYKVDFYWPELGLVVETDGLRYHRTPAQQAMDRRRDQVLTAAGLATLRFTHGQIRFEPGHVQATLSAVAAARHPALRSGWLAGRRPSGEHSQRLLAACHDFPRHRDDTLTTYFGCRSCTGPTNTWPGEHGHHFVIGPDSVVRVTISRPRSLAGACRCKQ